MHRRTFLFAAGCAGFSLPAPLPAADGGIRLGYDSWVFNGYGWTAIQYLDYAASQKLDCVQLSDLPNYASLEPAYLKQVRDHAQKLGIQIDGGLGCICPTAANWRKENGDPVEYVRRGLRANHAVGTRVMRVFLGGRGERTGPIPLEKHIEGALKILRAVRSEALDLGVKIGVETHGDLLAWEVKEIVETAGKDFVGATIDSRNPVGLAEDPMVTLETLGPYAVTTHIGDTVVFEHPRGAVTQSVALGEGSVDYVKFFERFRQLCPQVAVNLEVLTGSPPQIVPYLEPEFWKAFPGARASELARFAALARRGGPFMGSMLVGPRGERPPEYVAALRVQQRVDLERSLDYARKVLKLGLRSA